MAYVHDYYPLLNAFCIIFMQHSEDLQMLFLLKGLFVIPPIYGSWRMKSSKKQQITLSLQVFLEKVGLAAFSRVF